LTIYFSVAALARGNLAPALRATGAIPLVMVGGKLRSTATPLPV
jgi:hypothetical protein